MKTLWRVLTAPFRWAWNILSFFSMLTLNIFFIFILLIGMAMYAEYNGLANKTMPANGALLVNLAGTIVEQNSDDNPLHQLSNELLGNNRQQIETSLFEVVERIRYAHQDDRITGLVLSLKDLVNADMPSLQYIGKAIKEFKESGKPVIAIGDNYSQGQYYLASLADEIYLAPQGTVDLHGFSMNGLYYKSMLEKLKVNTHIFRVGTYKSAVEPYTRDNMSPEAREANSRWVNAMWNSYLSDVAQHRQISTSQLFPEVAVIIQRYRDVDGDSGAYALKNKLVDKLASRNQIETVLIERFGRSKNRSFNNISIYDYLPEQEESSAKNKIGVVLVNGTINDNPTNSDVANAESIVSQLRKARLDRRVKAVILRVNSPGGSVSASELIRSELETLRNMGKPIVVSMSGMAASGGYWISTPADYIIASPNTLTGSIGIFGIIPTLEKSLDSLGIHTDSVNTSPLAWSTITQEIPTEVSQLIQLQIEHGYKNFLQLVANSRHKTPTEVDAIAQGRVWIGADAKKLGLVDELGDFDLAVSKAAELAELGENAYQVTWYHSENTWAEKLFNQVSLSLQAVMPALFKGMLPNSYQQTLGLLSNQHNILTGFNDPKGQYIYCLNCSYTN